MSELGTFGDDALPPRDHEMTSSVVLAAYECFLEHRTLSHPSRRRGPISGSIAACEEL